MISAEQRREMRKAVAEAKAVGGMRLSFDFTKVEALLDYADSLEDEVANHMSDMEASNNEIQRLRWENHDFLVALDEERVEVQRLRGENHDFLVALGEERVEVQRLRKIVASHQTCGKCCDHGEA